MLVAQTCTELQSFKHEIARSKKGQAPCGRHATRAVGGALPKTGTAPWLGIARLLLKKLFLQGLFQGWCCCIVCGFLLYVCHFFLLVEIIYLSPTSLNLQILPAVWGSKVIYGSFLRTSQLESTCRVWPCFGGKNAVQSWGNHGRCVVTQMISNRKGYYESGIQQRMGSLSYLWIWLSQKGGREHHKAVKSYNWKELDENDCVNNQHG